MRSVLVLGVGLVVHSTELVSPVQRKCNQTSDTLAAGSTANDLGAEYELIIIGTSGAGAGRTVRGTLRLFAPPDSLRPYRRSDNTPHPYLTIPLIGTAVIDLARVGGLEDGELRSRDPSAPGVAVEEWNRTYQGKTLTQITLRLGSDANRRNVIRTDGPSNELFVDRIDSSGFSGRWYATLGLSDYEAKGYFCAIRR
jgi:hypothetical protein